MKYRGLTYNREKESYEWVYGMPSYGYETDEIAEIGTVYGDFKEIFPDTLGEQTPYRDKNGKRMYTGDIVALEVDGQVREFVVDKATGALDSKSSKMLLEKISYLNIKNMATILMVTHDAFTASYASRVIFIKDGRIFNELLREGRNRKEFFDDIMDVVTMLGGELNDAF